MKTKHKENYTIPLKLKQSCFKHDICAGGLIKALIIIGFLSVCLSQYFTNYVNLSGVETE
jgi:hypothetical protein